MRLNGRMVAAALAGVIAAAGAAGGYLLTAGSARADNAALCTATPALGGICSLTGVVLPPTSQVYLQFNPNLPQGITARAQVTWDENCDGQSQSNSQIVLPPNDLYINNSYAKSCTVDAKLQVWFNGTVTASTPPISVAMEINYQTPTSTSPSSPPGSGGGGGQGSGGPGFNGAIKGIGGKCVDDAANSSSIRAKVDIWNCNRGKSQQWNYSRGVVKHNGLCLNIKANGNAILWTCNGAANETFIFNTINQIG